MAITEFSAALNQVATERGIPVESVLESIRMALASAYKKDFGGDLEEIMVDLDPNTGEAKILKDDADVTPSGFGRIAAQTEKEVIMDEFKDKLGTTTSGTVFRISNDTVILDLGKAHGILPTSEQVRTEEYRIGQRLKVLIKDVREGAKGPEVIVSRADPEFLKKLFEQEVPEIATGIVKIEAIAREAGSRTKVAVSSSDDKIDPVGSCVGQKGVRVQAIISEVFGEKIDIVPYSPITEKFVAASLSPARVTEVELDTEERRAVVSVPEDQQSLAIGKEGQNARLANKLTTWRIDIKGAPSLFGTDETGSEGEKSTNVVRGIWDAEIAKQEKKDTDIAEKNGAEEEESVDDTLEN
jgi:transcription termination/antitermination protein NusA